MISLFKVADAFNVEDDEQSLILSPEWPLPDCGQFAIRDKITITTPAGEGLVFTADVSKKLFTLINGESVWYYVVTIPHGRKSDVPLGSEVFIEDELDSKLNTQLAGQCEDELINNLPNPALKRDVPQAARPLAPR